MTEIPAEVYEAAARAYDEPLRPIVVGTPAFRAAVDSAYSAGVAAGRAQAAAKIDALSRELHALRNPTTSALDVEFGGTITFGAEGGDPR